MNVCSMSEIAQAVRAAVPSAAEQAFSQRAPHRPAGSCALPTARAADVFLTVSLSFEG